MTTSRNARPLPERGNENCGLLANGSSGDWEVAIDEATSGAERWYAQIEGPTISFYFEIPSLDIVSEIQHFLERGAAETKCSPKNSDERNGSLTIGKDKKTPITLFQDDEYADRYFLVVGPLDCPMVRFTLVGRDVREIAEALRQVQEDLEDEE
jgi:hypothetical protein